MSFSIKLTSIIMAVLLASLALISYLGYATTTRIMESAIRRELETDAFHAMNKIDRLLFERQADMAVLCQDSALCARSSTPALITERLKDYRAKYKVYSSLSFFSLDHIMIADTSGKDIGKRHDGMEYWRELKIDKDFVSGVAPSSVEAGRLFISQRWLGTEAGHPSGSSHRRCPSIPSTP